ncbi:MAG TPA: hypothetical protein DD671_05770, partial [Balneolaceae bacterium]|nr:hypothetical protein [Balneolaceae bacterium]
MTLRFQVFLVLLPFIFSLLNQEEFKGGDVISWGGDRRGQVSQSPAFDDFIDISAGELHSIALREDVSVVVWGSDRNGQISQSPKENNFIDVSAGSNHNVALTENGKVVYWGWDY